MLVVVIEAAFFEPYADDFGVIFPEGPVIILLLVRYGFSDVYVVPPLFPARIEGDAFTKVPLYGHFPAFGIVLIRSSDSL